MRAKSNSPSPAQRQVQAGAPESNFLSVDVIRALALKQTGHAAEGEQRLKDWLAHDPKSDTAKWGLEVLAGKPAAASGDSKDPSLHILAASLP